MAIANPESNVHGHKVVSESEWLKASEEFLKREKEFTRERDALSAARRSLPWVKVEKNYIFESPQGKKSLADLFGDRSQLIVYHFMFAPEWDEGCDGCTFVSDHVDCARQHFEHHDVGYVAVSRAPLAKLEAYKERMGWTFPWVSSPDFNHDFNASFERSELDAGPVYFNFKKQPLKNQDQPGLTVFYKDENGDIFRTYSSYERGLDLLVGAYNFLDLTPKGRNENSPMEWMRRHDQYEND